MRLLRYRAPDGEARLAVRDGDDAFDTGYGTLEELLDHRGAVEHGAAADGWREHPLAPHQPRVILCCGFNYATHQAEGAAPDHADEPFFFAKLPTSVIGPGEAIRLPRPGGSVDWEAELALVIGRRTYRISEAHALDHVFAWTLLNDVSERDLQLAHGQLTVGKGVDTFCPIGPELVTSDELGSWQDVELTAIVNGETMQTARTGEMLFSPARLIADLSAFITLYPGDVVSTGTPAGVGAFRDPPVYLAPGDRVTISADAIGRLTNPVVAGW